MPTGGPFIVSELLTFENATNLIMLCFLQAVLGFDNLLYISIESQRAPVAQQKAVRMWGILIAVLLRVVLLFVMIRLIDALAEPFYTFTWTGVIEGAVNFATVIFIFGGAFLMYTAIKEIRHMLSMEHLGHSLDNKSGKSAVKVVVLIVMMNLIFSFDSVLSALAITDVFPILAFAILLSGAAMLLLADGVTKFLEKNRMYEVLGLFILLIVGVVLLGESGVAAGHAMHDESLNIKVFGQAIVPMSKSTFYFAVVVLFAVEVLQSGYARKLNAERAAAQKRS
ncbi:putative tellurium resistance membrane protein TerC [Loktanella ponticola]|uniref:Putative tellurium resistance membrane protein TerC n=1 Tax=Yoonia ponticola TaxID=1524255 RepID=A0A7W9BM31_9RHOB|nr:tellurium resistance protein TerC [Yoonia ponticola]MBB5722549.1 putative tellurium resistance membrane protein TerC [Yoonia ponticola]